MGQHKTAEHRNHKRVSAVFQKFVDPELKSAVPSELLQSRRPYTRQKSRIRIPTEIRRNASALAFGELCFRDGFHFLLGRNDLTLTKIAARGSVYFDKPLAHQVMESALPSTVFPSSADFAAFTTAPICFMEVRAGLQRSPYRSQQFISSCAEAPAGRYCSMMALFLFPFSASSGWLPSR